MKKALLVGVVVVVVLATFAGAASATVPTVAFDENGNGIWWDGTPLAWTVGPDPGPGGFPKALIYWLPATVTFISPGDLLISEDTGVLSDVVRFNQVAGTPPMIVFYSDRPEDPLELPDLADVGLPDQYQSPLVTMTEVGPEGNNWVDYTPLSGQPGYVQTSVGPLSYHIVSDGVVPEPGSLLALLFGISGLGGVIWRRRSA